MNKLTNKQIILLYKKMGISSPKFLDDKNVVNLFKILKIEPQYDQAGNRLKTPYEILGVLPKFKNNKEVPIIFAIKKRISKIGNYQGKTTKFVYKYNKVKEEKNILQTIKERYRAAIFAGNDALADNCLSMIGTLSKDELREFKDSFYDYSKFYKRMKKQLLIDLFSHFFLKYIENISSIIKNGIIKKQKIYKPYKENKMASLSDASEKNLNVSQIDLIQFGMQNIKKVVINNKEFEKIAVVDISEKEIKVKTNVSTDNVDKSQQINLNAQKNDKNDGFSGSIISTDNARNYNIDQYNLFNDLAENNSMPKKSYIKRRNKFLHKLGLFPQSALIEDEMKDYSSYAKKDKLISKEREIEI